MSTQLPVNDASTGQAGSEVDYQRLGRQMVLELQSFLRAELAKPREGRRISFLADRSNGATRSGATLNPFKE